MVNIKTLYPEMKVCPCEESEGNTLTPKTLVITYLPREDESNTKKLLDEFIAHAKNTCIDLLDLIETPPEFLTPDTLKCVMKRNYGGLQLTDDEEDAMAAMDAMTHQVMASDIVVLVTPMHNFSLPAPVKAFFDAILQKGMTWDLGESGYLGLMKGKKGLILMSCGGTYEGKYASMDHGMSLAKLLMGFMGLEVSLVTLAGTNRSATNLEQSLAEARAQVRAIAKEFYG